MADDAAATSDSKRHSGILWLIPVLVLAYALSPGPVYKTLGRRPSKAVDFIYAPLMYLSDHVDAVESFYDWYGTLWGLNNL